MMTIDRPGYWSKSHLDLIFPVQVGQGKGIARTPRQESEHQRHPDYRLLQDRYLGPGS
jgi:hypothetical protein